MNEHHISEDAGEPCTSLPSSWCMGSPPTRSRHMPANTAKTLARAGAGVVTRGGGRRQPSEHPQAGAVSVGNRFTESPLASAATSHASAGGVTFAERTSSMPAVAAERPAALGVRAAARVLSHLWTVNAKV